MPYTDSAARVGMGTLVQLGQNDATASPVSPESFKNIGEVTDVAKSGAKAGTHDSTNMQSIDGYKEFVAGLREAGTVKVTGNWVDPEGTFATDFTSQEDVEALFDSGEKRNYRIVVPPMPGEEDSPGFFSFSAIVESMGDSNFKPDGLITYSFSLKISGKYTYNDAP
jgi:hypothetical protein